MFAINDDLSIYLTRGDCASFTLMVDNGEGLNYMFQPGETVRFKVFGKKDCENVVMQKDFEITEATERVQIVLTGDETKFGDVISKPMDYWYEVELNPLTNPKTVIGYDDANGAKVLKLFPEGGDIP